MNNCPFCDNNRQKFLQVQGYNVSDMYFYEDEIFSISSDISPLVSGHLLVIPKNHYSSFGEIINGALYDKIKNICECLLDTKDLLLFEHGAVIEGEGGASVDHAHLHVMPRPHNLSLELIDEYIHKSGFVSSIKINATHDVLHKLFQDKQPYIFYEILGKKFAYPVSIIPHQFLRMMLQQYCKISYNWRITYYTDECKKNVQKTIDFVANNRM